MAVPSFSEWCQLSNEERLKRLPNPYKSGGEELIARIAEDFRKKYGHLSGLKVDGPGIHIGGTWVIDISMPFIFDRRLIPSSHLGIPVHKAVDRKDLPLEFRDG